MYIICMYFLWNESKYDGRFEKITQPFCSQGPTVKCKYVLFKIRADTNWRQLAILATLNLAFFMQYFVFLLWLFLFTYNQWFFNKVYYHFGGNLIFESRFFSQGCKKHSKYAFSILAKNDYEFIEIIITPKVHVW